MARKKKLDWKKTAKKTILAWAIGWSCFGLWFTYDSANDTYRKVRNWSIKTVRSITDTINDTLPAQ
jgi:hypothetical protein